MTTMLPMSGSDAAIINHVVPLDNQTLRSTSTFSGIPITDLYDLDSVVEAIVPAAARIPRFSRIALQFPDELLCDTSAVYWEVQRRIARRLKLCASRSSDTTVLAPQLFVLADTSYGNCCVDEVAASHVGADFVVHFGHACLSPTASLPVLYLFSRLPIDIRHAASELIQVVAQEEEKGKDKGERKKSIVLMYDVAYEHAALDVYELLVHSYRSSADHFSISKLDKTANFRRHTTESCARKAAFVNGYVEQRGDLMKVQEMAESTNNCNKNTCACAAKLPAKSHSQSPHHKFILPPHFDASKSHILYLGGESLALTNLLLYMGPSTLMHSYDPSQRHVRVETGATNRLLMRRYAAVQRARDASVVALVVGTLGVQSYLPLLASLRETLTRQHGRKVYTISVGKLSPAKLANFQEIDIFVLVACPENSLVELKGTGKDYYKPIVTPWEMQIALDGGRGWSGDYHLELSKVFEEGKKQEERQESDESDDEPHFSLVSGGLVSRRTRPERKDSGSEQRAEAGSVAIRSSDGILTKVLDSAGGAHVAGRSWRGLEQRLGMDEPADLEIGRTGIAKGYIHDDEIHLKRPSGN